MNKANSEPYAFLGRKLACFNSRFDIFFDRVSLPEGGELHDFLTVRPRIQDEKGIAGVIVLPELDGKVGLMHTYRHQFDCKIWQAPGGFLEPGDSAITAAARELFEETGLTSDSSKLVSLANYCPDPGLIEAQVTIFLADCSCGQVSPDAFLEIGVARLEFFSPFELRHLLISGAKISGATMVAAYAYLDRLTGRMIENAEIN